MKPIRKKRLQTVLLILAGSALGSFFIIRALDTNLDFSTPIRDAFRGNTSKQRIKVGGMVLENLWLEINQNIFYCDRLPRISKC